MRNNGKRGGGAVDSGDPQAQVMSPPLPPALHGSTVSVNSVPVPVVHSVSVPVSLHHNVKILFNLRHQSRSSVPVYLTPLYPYCSSFSGTP